MLEGKIINLDPEKKQGQVEQLTTQRVFPFTYNVWEGEEEELATNLEVEFVVENRVITKMKLKISLEELDAIPVTKPANECINEFFARETSILSDYQDFVAESPELDFMRMRRFLFTAYNDLCDLFGGFHNINLNRLDYNEIKQFVNILNHYGFWNKFSAERIDKKEDFIRTECKGQIKNIILKLLNSKNILDSFQKLIASIRTKKGYYEAILFILIARVSKLDLDLEDLAYSLNMSQLNSIYTNFKRNYLLRYSNKEQEQNNEKTTS